MLHHAGFSLLEHAFEGESNGLLGEIVDSEANAIEAVDSDFDLGDAIE